METVCLVNNETGEVLEIPPDESTIGRGHLLKVTDKRVSRQHALLRKVDEKLSLLPKHKNPCFYKPVGDSEFQTLPRDQWKELSNGDCFSLLPNDLVFRVVYPGKSKVADRTNNSRGKKESNNSQSDPLNELFDPSDIVAAEGTKKTLLPLKTQTESSMESTPMKTGIFDKEGQKVKGSSDDATERQLTTHQEKLGDVVTTKQSIKLTKPSLISSQSGTSGKKRVLPSWLSGLSCDEGPVNIQPAPKKKKVVLPKVSSKVSVTGNMDRYNEIDSLTPKKLPTRHKATEKAEAAVESPEPDEFKTEKSLETGLISTMDAAVTPVSGDTGRRDTTVRESPPVSGDTEKEDKPLCPYGTACYRKNQVHFKEFSHNFTSESFDSHTSDSAASDSSDKPICPYGNDCYRKNPDHKEKYRHLDVPAAESESVDHKPFSSTRKRRSNRTAKGKRSAVVGESDDDGEPNTYDYKDSFIDDEEDNDSGSSFCESEDSNWSPGDDHDHVREDKESEDINDLISEADNFINNEKMRKTSS